MSYACLSVCLSLSAFLWYFFLGFFFAHFNSIERRCCKEMRGPAKCATHLCLVCVCETCVCIGCKLKRSSSHTKTTTRTSALMLHLPCLFTASCPFVGHTHTHMDHIHMCENGFYFNPFFLSSFGVCPADCVLCAAHPSALIAFDCSALLSLLLLPSRSRTVLLLSLSYVLCLFVVLLIYAINWHNLWPIVQAKNKNIAEFTL